MRATRKVIWLLRKSPGSHSVEGKTCSSSGRVSWERRPTLAHLLPLATASAGSSMATVATPQVVSDCDKMPIFRDIDSGRVGLEAVSVCGAVRKQYKCRRKEHASSEMWVPAAVVWCALTGSKRWLQEGGDDSQLINECEL